MAKIKKKSKGLNFAKTFFLVIFNIFVAIFVTIIIDLFKNINQRINFALHPEEKERIKMKLSTEKTIDLINERLQRIERLVYSMFEEPDYSKRSEGKSDLKDLKNEVK